MVCFIQFRSASNLVPKMKNCHQYSHFLPKMATLSSLPILPRCRCSPAMVNGNKQQRSRVVTAFAAKSGPLNSILKRCQKCGGKGAIECPGCKGTGKNKKNGNIFERWKCFDCQGFGLKSCPKCGQGGLTPEQRGER